MKQLATLVVALAFIGHASSAADHPTSPDKLDPELAMHPEAGRLYVQSFNAGVRFPKEFRGEWSNIPSLCGTDDGGEGNKIVGKAVTFHYSDETHVATKIVAIGPSSIRIIYGPLIKDYHYFEAPSVLTLSKQGKVLEDREGPGGGLMNSWTKCPPESGATR